MRRFIPASCQLAVLRRLERGSGEDHYQHQTELDPRHPDRDPARTVDQQADRSCECYKRTGKDDKGEASVVFALVGTQSVSAHQSQQRVVENLHRPQDAGHEESRRRLRQEEESAQGW